MCSRVVDKRDANAVEREAESLCKHGQTKNGVSLALFVRAISPGTQSPFLASLAKSPASSSRLLDYLNWTHGRMEGGTHTRRKWKAQNQVGRKDVGTRQGVFVGFVCV